jgi:dTDP-glucose pyrophosphorylase
MLHKLILKDSTSFAEAVGLLDLNGNGFLPVVAIDGKLVGILTDGDVRRAILKNITDVRSIINTAPTIALNTEERHAIIRRLHHLKRRHMPVVDKDGRYVDVIVLNDFNIKSILNRVVIMAGGLGTRLGELTKETPKPMLMIKGKPILERIIESFKGYGFHDFTFCLNYKSEIIENHFGDGSKFSVSINYTIEEKRLGTAGALSLIDKSLLNEPFLVTNGDILTALNYEDFMDTHKKTSSIATMCVKQHSMQLPYANIISDEDGNLVSLEEKPHIPFYINAGIYALDPEVLDRIPYNEYFDMPSLFGALLAEGRPVKTYKMDDYWVDIGMPNDFRQANDKV